MTPVSQVGSVSVPDARSIMIQPWDRTILSGIEKAILAANIGTFAVMLPFIARLRVGWGYVSERLKERKTYYEANQRGLFATKDREMQLRDRLSQQQEVR